MALQRIEIQHVLEFDELVKRLRNVRLKGFPDVKIYEDSDFINIKYFSPQRISEQVFTPQPAIYRNFLDRIDRMREIFSERGINIFRLEGGIDYTAFDENGQETNWTIIPPVIEVLLINFANHRPDYSKLIGKPLEERMIKEGHRLNPEVSSLSYDAFDKFSGLERIPIICDGSHRIHSAYEKGIEQNLLVIDTPRWGYPYYAAPKPYSKVHVEQERPEGGSPDKTHVLTEPGHKLLYRLFPSGGILSGDVRPVKK